MNDYQRKKEAARQKAIDWQYESSQTNMSYEELAAAGRMFMRLAKRYGLTREFHENAII